MYKRIIALLMAVVMLFGTISGSIHTAYAQSEEKSTVQIVEDGIYIKGTYYTIQEFETLLEKAEPITSSNEEYSTRSMAPLIAGTWWIPGVGKVVITVAGVVIIAGVAIKATSWTYKKVRKYFQHRALIENIKRQIPGALKNGKGDVDIGKFKTKLKSGQGLRGPKGWIIQNDDTNHRGRGWKLKRPNGKRVATLDKTGKVVDK